MTLLNLLALLAAAAPAGGDAAPTFDLRTIPWSRPGAYLAVSHLAADGQRPDGPFLRTVRGAPAHASIFVLEPLAGGKPVRAIEKPSPSRLRLEADGGRFVELVFAEPKVLRVRGRGLGLRFRMWTVPPVNSAYPGPGRRFIVNNSPNGVKLMFTPITGTIAADAPWDGVKSSRIAIDLLPDATGAMEGAVEEYTTAWRSREYVEKFDVAERRVAADFAAFAATFPAVAPPYRAAAPLAKYLLWSNVVDPDGYLKRRSIYMSKNLMTGVWSWDHGFNAMSLARAHPELAWEQMMTMFDLQAPDGSLPDRVTDRTITWAHNKPPVHGWMLRKLMQASPWFRDERRLAEIYGPLARWTEFWFTYRDDDGDGLPQYNHGNDSGWDNATPLLAGVPLESPDLSAYLVVQMDVLAEVATKLGKADEAKRWKTRADALLGKLLTAFWRGDHFVAYPSGAGKEGTATRGDSLLLFLPIVLGPRLPADVRDKLLAGLKQEGRFLTAHGLATESPKSPLYEADGYWRGPIWAPSTLILVDGITAAGDSAFAREVAKRFCDTLATSQMPENFDALTGKDRRDPGYTWTSAVYLILGAELATTAR